MTKQFLDKEIYLCKLTGQDVKVSEGRIYCPAIRNLSDCIQNTLGSGKCLVYLAMYIAHAQISSNYTEQNHKENNLHKANLSAQTTPQHKN